ncbi:hypothetical protein UlMin_024134 [Ulmus minor]
MSQQKFASNVIEKCLTFGTPIERQILVTRCLKYTYRKHIVGRIEKLVAAGDIY